MVIIEGKQPLHSTKPRPQFSVVPASSAATTHTLNTDEDFKTISEDTRQQYTFSIWAANLSSLQYFTRAAKKVLELQSIVVTAPSVKHFLQYNQTTRIFSKLLLE